MTTNTREFPPKKTRKLSYQRYGGRTDGELCVLLFGAFIFPIGAYFICEISGQRRLLAAVLFPSVGLLLAVFVAYVVAAGKRFILKQSQSISGNGGLDGNPVGAVTTITSLVILVSFIGSTVVMNVILGLPDSAWFVVVVFSVLYAVLFGIASSFYYSYPQELKAGTRYGREGLKERLQAARTLFNVTGLILAALVIAPAFSFRDILEPLKLSGPAEGWAIVWFYATLLWLGVSLLNLLMVRIVDLHSLWLVQLDDKSQT